MSEEKQMTPLQELIEWVNKNSFNTEDQAGVKFIAVDADELKEFAQSLLPKEKQGIIDAVDNTKGYYTDREYVSSNLTGEQYFNSKYNQ